MRKRQSKMSCNRCANLLCRHICSDCSFCLVEYVDEDKASHCYNYRSDGREGCANFKPTTRHARETVQVRCQLQRSRR